jgi:hypothetical protein
VAWVFVQTIAQHTKEGLTFSHTHTKKKRKEQLKLKTVKIVLRKPKEGKKRKPTRKN